MYKSGLCLDCRQTSNQLAFETISPSEETVMHLFLSPFVKTGVFVYFIKILFQQIKIMSLIKFIEWNNDFIKNTFIKNMLQSAMLEMDQFSFITSVLFLSQYSNQNSISLLHKPIIEEYLFIYFYYFQNSLIKSFSSYSGISHASKIKY